MKRSEFIKSMGLGLGGLLVGANIALGLIEEKWRTILISSSGKDYELVFDGHTAHMSMADEASNISWEAFEAAKPRLESEVYHFGYIERKLTPQERVAYHDWAEEHYGDDVVVETKLIKS
tara:strand:+ start:851 stop:1210 length:360 start_codon:yes stop_codon:yes gene_type:complete